MQTFLINNNYNGLTIAIARTNMDAEVFSKEFHDFLTNGCKNNFDLTVEQFEEKLKSNGHTVEVLKIDHEFEWWQDQKPEDCRACGRRLIGGHIHPVKGKICAPCFIYFKNQA
jgi:hypothetical protein